MNKALIITPTGCDPFFDDNYDRDNHWAFRKPNRTYETCAVIFNDYTPKSNTYDYVLRMSGRKWNLIPEACEKIKWEDYDYIGCWDDDYCTDIQSVEKTLEIARALDFRLFQQSLISWTVYPILEHNPELIWSETNFIELGIPFFRNDIFRKVLRFLNDYKYEESDWGIDKVLCYYLQATAHVIHETTIKHCRSESSYSKEAGFKEMNYLMRDFFPKYMKKNFNVDYEYCDRQIMYKALKKETVK